MLFHLKHKHAGFCYKCCYCGKILYQFNSLHGHIHSRVCSKKKKKRVTQKTQKKRCKQKKVNSDDEYIPDNEESSYLIRYDDEGYQEIYNKNDLIEYNGRLIDREEYDVAVLLVGLQCADILANLFS